MYVHCLHFTDRKKNEKCRVVRVASLELFSARAASRGRFIGKWLISVDGDCVCVRKMMDFSALVADLRDVAEKYKGKSSEPQVSTVVYVDMFTKVCDFDRGSDLHPLRAPVRLPWKICTESRTPFSRSFATLSADD